jgi:predicted SnoaL-like aldol condensation-catalyzing enzyme
MVSGLRWIMMLGLGGLLAGCAETTLTLRAARAQQNSAVALAFLDTVFNKHEVDLAFRRYVGPGLRDHTVGPAAAVDGARVALLRQVTGGGDTLHIDIAHSIAQGDMVAIQSNVAGATESQAAAGTARFDLFRLSRGRIIEHWSLSEVPGSDAR